MIRSAQTHAMREAFQSLGLSQYVMYVYILRRPARLVLPKNTVWNTERYPKNKKKKPQRKRKCKPNANQAGKPAAHQQTIKVYYFLLKNESFDGKKWFFYHWRGAQRSDGLLWTARKAKTRSSLTRECLGFAAFIFTSFTRIVCMCVCVRVWRLVLGPVCSVFSGSLWVWADDLWPLENWLFCAEDAVS